MLGIILAGVVTATALPDEKGLPSKVEKPTMRYVQACYAKGMYPYADQVVVKEMDKHTVRKVKVKCLRDLTVQPVPKHTNFGIIRLVNQITMCTSIGGQMVKEKGAWRCKVNKHLYKWTNTRQRWSY